MPLEDFISPSALPTVVLLTHLGRFAKSRKARRCDCASTALAECTRDAESDEESGGDDDTRGGCQLANARGNCNRPGRRRLAAPRSSSSFEQINKHER